MTSPVDRCIVAPMSTSTSRPQYTVRYGAGLSQFFGANYPKALAFALDHGPSTIELADGTVIRMVG